MKQKKLLFVVNVDWFFISHRLPLALAAKEAGYDVWVAATDTGRGDKIRKHGIHFIPFSFSRKGTNIFSEIWTFPRLFRLFGKVQPDIVHLVTIKPVLFGSIAARFRRKLIVINAITGLGFTFSKDGRSSLLGFIVRTAYRVALKNPRQHTIFQNPDDQEQFVSRGFLEENQSAVIKGSGVDCSKFVPAEVKNHAKIVLLASRMIRDKGIYEFYEAAKQIKERNPDVKFVLAGMSDEGNPNTVPAEQLNAWASEGVVEWWGHCQNMVEVLQKSSIVVLPTYYPEGVPKILIEAAACGKPVVTTDRAGCREIVRNQVNGLLIEPKDVPALRNAVEYLLDRPDVAETFGQAGREIAIEEFSQEIVIQKTLDLYSKRLNHRSEPE